MRNTKYSEKEYLQFADDAIEILDLLNRNGIIHRDLNQGNVMIRTHKSGKRLALIDFMYSVSPGNYFRNFDKVSNILADMPFNTYTPQVINGDEYPKGYHGHCDLKGMSNTLAKRFQPKCSRLGELVRELNAQVTAGCKLDYTRLRNIMDNLWKQGKLSALVFFTSC